MVHYYSQIQGHRGKATRTGHKTSGITARADSYSIGARIKLEWSDFLQTDIVHVYRTSGSSSNSSCIMSYALILMANLLFFIMNTRNC